MIGCDCDTCRSTDPRDKRWRASVLHRDRRWAGAAGGCRTRHSRAVAGVRCPPRRRHHLHARPRGSHHGLDDIRRFNAMQQRPMPCYGDEATLSDLRRTFFYVVRSGDAARRRPAAARAVPYRRPVLHRTARNHAGSDLSRQAADPRTSHRHVRVPDRLQPHSRRVLAAARGLDLLVLDALRETPHPTHFSLVGSHRRQPHASRPADLLHAHVPRSSACRHLREAPARHGARL